MRIAAITASFLPRVGGAEFAVHNLARQWGAAGHEVTVYNQIADRPTHPEANYDVRRYKILPGMTRFKQHRQPFSWFVTRQLGKIIRDTKPDVISAHFGFPTAMWLSRLRPVPPYMVTCHGPALDDGPHSLRARYGLDPLLTRTFAKAGRVVAISSHARRQLEGLGVASDKIVDIPNGVDTARFGNPVDGFDLREKTGLGAEAIVILSVGRNTWEKAYDVAIDAFAIAAQQVPRLHYVMVGRDTAAWASRAHERGVGDRVHFHDGLYDQDLVGAYQQADVFMLPSKQELCPLVVPEAMAAGRPELVTDVSGSQDMVVDGENGLIVPPGQPEPLAQAMIRLGSDPELRRRMGAASLVRSANYDWARIAARHLEHAPRLR